MFLCNEILGKIILHSVLCSFSNISTFFLSQVKQKAYCYITLAGYLKCCSNKSFAVQWLKSKTLTSEANTKLSGPSGLRKAHARVLQIRLEPRMLYGFVIWVFFGLFVSLKVPLKFADCIQILVTCISSAGPQNRVMEFGIVAIHIPVQFCLGNCAEKHQVLLWSQSRYSFPF